MALNVENVLWTRRPQRMQKVALLPPFKALKKLFEKPEIRPEHLKEMLPNLSPSFLQLSFHWVAWVFRRMASHSWVAGCDQLEKLKEFDSSYSIVFVANHRSNADYLFLPLLINRAGLSNIHILGNSKLNIFPFGWLFKKWGAYFVRQGEKNRYYYDLLKSWGAYLLEHSHNLLFFPEGGLSQDGNLRRPKTGFLKTLIESPHASKIIIVPVMLAYDWIPEDRQLTFKKNHQPEHWTYWNKIKMLKFFRNYGNLYCRVYEPLMVGDWLKQNQQDLPETLLDRVFERFRTQPILAPSSILAKVILDNPAADQNTLKNIFVGLCQQYQNQLAFQDYEREFERVYKNFKFRELFKQESILRFYVNQLEFRVGE